MIRYIESDGGRVQCGFGNERRDCTVRAAVVRFTTSYARAHDLLARIGRRDGHGLKKLAVKAFLEAMGLEIIRPLAPITLNQFIKQNPTGRFYVVIRGHALGVNNGVCVDTGRPGLRARVLFYA